ncbi:DUF3006 domain-containing protein [Clostridium gasigenes]|uniref:DUF3006 domain-containing protein n=3 Tax=Clostridium gasigenes TaxID=94869 RepID=A0A1H0Q0S5_9CLOT|nr:DUF3006 domain-containing protein [Clostridium gasigenes]SDP10992.1 Protein of unknown function [Clostridium gasigenes]
MLLFMCEYFIVDRIHEENITIESPGGEMSIITKNEALEFVKEGDVLVGKDNIYVIDIKETKNRKIKVKKFMKGMWQE